MPCNWQQISIKSGHSPTFHSRKRVRSVLYGDAGISGYNLAGFRKLASTCQVDGKTPQGEILFQRPIIIAALFVLAGLLTISLFAHAGPVNATGKTCDIWPSWNSFRQKFVSDDGRVVDRSIPQQITTSEGQAYALMFALIANDRASFDLILRWTENNLASGDLTGQLPGWQWGQRTDGSWGVIDGNAASDADLWIAYVLHEAGQLWEMPRYTARAELLAARILREETAQLPGLGLALLPGPRGFHPDETTWRLNPSYMPIQIMRRFAALYPNSGWQELARTSIEVITLSAPDGFVPEWVDYQADHGFIKPAVAAVGFNAIRVYLWAGMLDSRDAASPLLLNKLAAMGKHVSGNGTTGENASAGFSSALLPFLKASGLADTLHQQRQRIVALAPQDRDDNYYDQVLTLFGLGWLAGRYRFGRQGQLIPGWECAQY